ncbi:MAG TPA: hypothetical protein VJI46_04545 [Candidatus Nanoarchaeia archaeon]|nr:hypothetical protein [Candidatus Nanoarchaeia archaeon]
MAIFGPPSFDELHRELLELGPACAAINYDFRLKQLDSSLVRKNKLILKKRVEALLKNLGERRIINNEEIIKLAGLKERKKEFGRLKEENKMITKFMDDFIDKIETGASLAR